MAGGAVRRVLLPTGRAIPCIGFGTGTAWFKRGGDGSAPELCQKTVTAVKAALQAGYRHIDCAEMYGTEPEVGVAIRDFCSETGTTREQLYVTTKIWKGLPDVKQSCKASLERLGLTYVDLYLIHAPFFSTLDKGNISLEQVWRDMESLVDDGLVKDIGVSNYRVSDLQALLGFARIKPAVNQVEAHPYLQQPELCEFCARHGIVMEAYSPLTSITTNTGGPVDDAVEEAAKAHGITPAQVLLLWSQQSGYVPITTSSKPERLQEFLEAGKEQSAQLSADEVAKIASEGAKQAVRRFWVKDFSS